MNVRELEQILFEELGFAGSPGLFAAPDIPWPNGRVIPDIDQALFLKHVPIAYFSRLNELDLGMIRQLHKNVWSQSKAPLLFVTLPHEVRIYSGYQLPLSPDEELEELNARPRLLQHLRELSDHLTARREIQEKLVEANHYERIYLETGAFWDTDEGQEIGYESRADKQLVEGMGQMRKLLIEAGLSNSLAYTLLGRSIFIRYLEDREALTPDWTRQMTNGKVAGYPEALEAGRDVTYRLFEQLSQRFNGDLFPIEPEERDVNENHLRILHSFLSGTNLETGQLSLLPYNFEYIPIELISHIYDTFIDDRRSSGAYYTPLLLADFVLEEALGDEVIHPEMTVLDPACGSGIFLVGAYRRLVQAWRRERGKPTPEDLNRILRQNIFGVDESREAVRIAAFSLYLEILNHLTNEQIRNEAFRFPPLQEYNLLASDFFAEEVDDHFAPHQFDRVVGNMPWGKGTLTERASKWLAANDYAVGGKQAAPAFMLRAPDFCKDSGEIALLAPAKSTILVTSDTHQAFRDRFFQSYHVRAVVNFSLLVYELFPKAISPAVTVFYSPTSPDLDSKLIYGVPKPSSLSQRLKAVVLDTTEIKFLDRRDLLHQPHLWKVALWGTPRDAALIRRLMNIPTLREQSSHLGWKEAREGFQIGESKDEKRQKKRKPTPDYLKQLPFLPTDRFQSFFISTENLNPIEANRVWRSGDKERFRAPLVLIHQSKCRAAYVNTDISFLASMSAVNGERGQEDVLKWLTCVINSPLTLYYQFLTSTRWGVERSNPLHKEYKDMPFLIPDANDQRYKEVIHQFDQLAQLLAENDDFFNQKHEQEIAEREAAIDQLVYSIYSLHSIEKQLVQDMIEYGIGYFNWAKRKTRKPRGVKPVQEPELDMLTAYSDIFSRTATSVLRVNNQTLNATVYNNGAPLTVVSFDLVTLDKTQSVRVVTQPNTMRTKLRELDRLLLERRTPSMYMRRHVRIYDNNQLSLVRPSEQRFWTQSQARADADAFLAELSSAQ